MPPRRCEQDMKQPGKTVLITGANVGLGKDVARQLALRPDFDRIYLGCRNPAKAEQARRDLERVTGRSIFEVVVVDLSNLDSVRAAASAIERPLDAVLLNAGPSESGHRCRQRSEALHRVAARRRR